MIRVTITLNTTALDAASDLAQELPGFVRQVGLPILDKIAGPMLSALQHYPSPPNYAYGEFPWVSERQRRFVMAKLGGQKYKRTFGLRRAWRVVARTHEGRISLTVANASSAAQFVVGRFNQRSRAEAAIPVQPFHAPRWPLAVDVVAPFFVRAEKEFTKAAAKGFDDAIRVKTRKVSRFR